MMEFDDMTPVEKVEYKERVIADFTDHGMTDEEALVCYVYMVNSEPYRWMAHKYQMGKDKCEKLIVSGQEKYRSNNGGIVMKPAPEKDHVCKCRKAVIPQ